MPLPLILAAGVVDSGHRRDVGLCFQAGMSTTHAEQIRQADSDTLVDV